jgi:hypothetical protein
VPEGNSLTWDGSRRAGRPLREHALALLVAVAFIFIVLATIESSSPFTIMLRCVRGRPWRAVPDRRTISMARQRLNS